MLEMKFPTKIILSGLAVIFVAIFWLSNPSFISSADCADHSFLGWAWSENVGWISFSCKNTSSTIDYGVDKNPSTGLLSGQAWSDNIGWISFDSADLAGCPSGICEARMSSPAYSISGWARAMAASSSASGWDGWIKLNGTTTEASPAPYGVFLNNTTKELYGWAWGGNTADVAFAGVIGWISFNCSDTGSCGTIDYNVHLAVSTPAAANLTSPANTSENYCGDSASFEWLYQDSGGSPLDSYQFRVNTTGNASDTNPVIDLSIPNRSDFPNTTITQPIAVKIIPGANELAYNTAYYWWVKVCNQGGVCSEWAKGPDFSTPEKRYPIPGIAWNIQNISIWDAVQFCSTADVADPSDPCYPICWTGSESSTPEVGDSSGYWKCSVCYDSLNQKQACQGAGYSYYWDSSNMDIGVGYEFATGSSAVSSNPRIKFLKVGKDREIRLNVFAGSDSCVGRRLLNSSLPIPKWKEISPF